MIWNKRRVGSSPAAAGDFGDLRVVGAQRLHKPDQRRRRFLLEGEAVLADLGASLASASSSASASTPRSRGAIEERLVGLAREAASQPDDAHELDRRPCADRR